MTRSNLANYAAIRHRDTTEQERVKEISLITLLENA